MQVVITARHMTLTPQMREHIERKANKLTKYYDRIQQIDVVVERGDSALSVEALVNAEHKMEFVSRVTGTDVLSAMDAVVDKLERQLSDHKERFRNRKHPPR
jgi:putative sigma-54 modulation protein